MKKLLLYSALLFQSTFVFSQNFKSSVIQDRLPVKKIVNANDEHLYIGGDFGVAKYDTNHTLIWERKLDFIDYTYYAYVHDIAIDSKENIYMIGEFSPYGSGSFNFGSKTFNTVSGHNSIFIFVWDSQGNQISGNQLIGEPYPLDCKLAVSNDTVFFAYSGIIGALGLTGNTSNLLWATPLDNPSVISNLIIKGPFAYLLSYSNGGYNIIKHDLWNSRQLIFKTQVAVGDRLEGFLSTDKSNNLYLGGTYKDNITIGGQNFNAVTSTNARRNTNPFLAKFDSSANLIWAKSIEDKNGAISHRDILVNENNLFIGGNLENNAKLGSDSIWLKNGDTFIARYDLSGNLNSFVQCGSNKPAYSWPFPSSYRDSLASVCILKNRLYFTGVYEDSAYFGSALHRGTGYTSIYTASALVNSNNSVGIYSAQTISKEGFSVFPNPSTGMYKLTSKETIKNIEVSDILGKVVYKSNQNTAELDITAFPKGIYFLKATTNKSIISQKIIKE